MFTSDFRNEFEGHNNVHTVEFSLQEKTLAKTIFSNDNI